MSLSVIDSFHPSSQKNCIVVSSISAAVRVQQYFDMLNCLAVITEQQYDIFCQPK
jgi:hypothetical protein